MKPPTPIPTNLTHFQSWLDKQSLDKSDATALGVRLLTAEQSSELLGFSVFTSTVLIPYYMEDYFRLRKLGPLAKGEAKYLSRRGSGCAPAYLPPAGADWNDVRADVAKDVVITEGEVKAYWGCKSGKLTIGIGGVDMQDTLFDGSWEWRGRKVRICFDHDEGQEPGTYKPGVHNALGRLCSKLAAAGAEVGVLHVGRAFDGEGKCGLDDYLRAGGKWDRLLLTETAPEEWCEQLAELLESCVYVVGTNHTHIYNLWNGSRKTPSDFHDAHIDKVRLVMTPKKDGSVFPKPVQVSRQWVEHPKRVTVDNYDLDPRLPYGVQGNKMNLWRGYPVWESSREVEWQAFMEGLFGEHWKWVGLWVGHLLNRPEEKCTQAVMLITMVQGIGKSLFGDIVRDLCGEHGLEGSSSRMFGNFNAMEEGKTFVVVNELDVKFSSKEGQLNDLLTEEVVKIEQKGKDTILLPNLRRWYFTTNTSSPARLSKGQRRVLVIHPPRIMADTRGEWGEWVRSEVAGWRKDPAALGYIRGWFDKLWYESGEGEGVWDSTAPVPVTFEAEEAAEASMTTGQIIANDMYEFICSLEGKWAAVHPDLRKRNAKAWGDVSTLVKAHGGYVLQKSIKEAGIVKAYTIFDVDGVLPRERKTNGGHMLRGEGGGHVGHSNMNDEIKARSEAIAKRFVEISDILVGNRG